MLTVPINVYPDGGDRYTIVAEPRDIYVWERAESGRNFSTMAEAGIPWAAFFELAHITLRRLGHVDMTTSLAAFAKTTNVEPGEEEPEPDPTSPVPSATSS